jgi:hypothetical protein
MPEVDVPGGSERDSQSASHCAAFPATISQSASSILRLSGFSPFTSTVRPIHSSSTCSVGGLPLVPTRWRLHLCLLNFKVVIFAFHKLLSRLLAHMVYASGEAHLQRSQMGFICREGPRSCSLRSKSRERCRLLEPPGLDGPHGNPRIALPIGQSDLVQGLVSRKRGQMHRGVVRNILIQFVFRW